MIQKIGLKQFALNRAIQQALPADVAIACFSNILPAAKIKR